MRVLYSALLVLLLPFALLRLFIRGFRDHRYWHGVLERFGGVQVAESRPLIWLHAVSVGEVRAAEPLVNALKKSYPNYTCHITTTTPTGAEMVKHLFGQAISHSYFPYDLPFFVNRYLNRLKPSLVLIVETEIWPNHFYACAQRDIPLCLLNARLSESSFTRYKKLTRLTSKTLQDIVLVAAKSEADRQRFISLGVDPLRAVSPGNLKFDIELDENVFERALKLRTEWGSDRKVWVAGSTHPGEDEIILDAHSRVLQQYPDALLILVPRHPERAADIADLCEQADLKYNLSSKLGNNEASQILIGDQLGELQGFYAAADAAFVGGSLVPHGGQNPLEPAVAGIPVLTGPHISNFEDVYKKLEAVGAVVTVKGSASLSSRLCNWFADPDSGKSVGESARQVIAQNKGAVSRTIELLRPFL